MNWGSAEVCKRSDREVLLNRRARYICACDKLTQLLAALIRFGFSVISVSMAHAPENSLNRTLFWFSIFSLLKKTFGCMFTKWLHETLNLFFYLIYIYIYERFSFYSKDICVWCTQQINTKKEMLVWGSFICGLCCVFGVKIIVYYSTYSVKKKRFGG